MPSYRLQIGTEMVGPLTEEEVRARLADGLDPQTPCALDEATLWRPVVEVLGGGGLKLRRGKVFATTAEDASRAVRIDLATRKRLLAYGLADAITIEGFTQTQAEQAIRETEVKLRVARRLHTLTAGLAALALLAAGLWIGLEANPLSRTMERALGRISPQTGDARVNHTVFIGVMRREKEDRARAERERARPTPQPK
jgi:hypothetical protein